VEESNELVRLVGHPLQLGRVEPTASQRSDLPRVHIFDVQADRACHRGGDRHELPAVADAHREALDTGPAARFVAELRSAPEECAGEFHQQVLGHRALIDAGRRHPDMYRITHRKKVTR
jgi:hypothetical protein